MNILCNSTILRNVYFQIVLTHQIIDIIQIVCVYEI